MVCNVKESLLAHLEILDQTNHEREGRTKK